MHTAKSLKETRSTRVFFFDRPGTSGYNVWTSLSLVQIYVRILCVQYNPFCLGVLIVIIVMIRYTFVRRSAYPSRTERISSWRANEGDGRTDTGISNARQRAQCTGIPVRRSIYCINRVYIALLHSTLYTIIYNIILCIYIYGRGVYYIRAKKLNGIPRGLVTTGTAARSVALYARCHNSILIASGVLCAARTRDRAHPRTAATTEIAAKQSAARVRRRRRRRRVVSSTVRYIHRKTGCITEWPYILILIYIVYPAEELYTV